MTFLDWERQNSMRKWWVIEQLFLRMETRTLPAAAVTVSQKCCCKSLILTPYFNINAPCYNLHIKPNQTSVCCCCEVVQFKYKWSRTIDFPENTPRGVKNSYHETKCNLTNKTKLISVFDSILYLTRFFCLKCELKCIKVSAFNLLISNIVITGSLDRWAFARF